MQQKLRDDVSSGLVYSLIHFNELNSDIINTINLYQDESSNVQVLKEKWGGYSLLSIKSSWNNILVGKNCFIGVKLFENEELLGLYLADRSKYLAISGQTRITGNAYLPQQGIRSVVIDGNTFKGNTLIYGKQLQSNKNLQGLSKDFMKDIAQLQEYTAQPEDSIMYPSELGNRNKIIQSFENKTIVINSEKIIELDNIELKGRIIIRSDVGIKVSSNANISDAILVAPKIILKENLKGNMQLVVSDTLLIEENVNMKYPSGIYLISEYNSTPLCYIDKSSRIAGSVVLKSTMEESGEPLLEINNDVIIYGLVYCDGKVKHVGSIIGSLYCKRFTMQTSKGIYENHLLDAVIDPRALNSDFVVPAIFPDNLTQSIVKCVH